MARQQNVRKSHEGPPIVHHNPCRFGTVDDWAVAISSRPPRRPARAADHALIAPTAASPAGRRAAAPARASAVATLAGTLALAGLVAATALVALTAAAAPTSLLSTYRTMPRYFPAWLAGPLHAVGLETSSGVRIALVLVVCGCYAIVLPCARAIPRRRLWAAIVLAHVAVALAPPLESGDVFGYLGFARLAALHGISPYAAPAAAAPHDAIAPLLGWHTVATPYGPLFTLLTEALVPLGIAGGMWVLKALAALASLATVLAIWRIAERLGRARRAAIAFYGLNPLVLLFAVAGAHNETLFGMFLALAVLALVAGREVEAGTSLGVATALKPAAGLMLPFALIDARRRGRAAATVAATLVAALAVGVAVFGPHVLGVGSAWLTEQREVAGHSIPSQVSKLLSLGELAHGVRIAFIALFVVVLLASLWRCLRGAWWLDCYGWATFALLAATAWILPWYGLWVLLPASVSPSRRLRAAALLATAYLVGIRILVSSPLSAG
jgi:hypothetical protein